MTAGVEAPIWRLVSKRGNAIVPLGGQAKGCPFFCVHSIAGEVASLRPLAQILGTERQIYGIQVPTERLGSNFATSVRAVAEYYADMLTAFRPEGPLLLGGWSAGSVIALEMAQTLQRRGRPVHLLVVLDGILYNTGAGVSAWNPLYYWYLAINLPNWIGDNLASGWGVRGVADRVKRELRLTVRSIFSPGRKARPGSAVDAFADTSRWPPEQAAFARSLFDALERYEPKSYSGRVLIYVAKTQPLFHLLQVSATWSKIASEIETVPVDGTHISMMREPRVAALAADLRARLAAFGPVSDRCAEKAADVPDSVLEFNLHRSTPT
jgi:phthiocerol/phenolphthiocerol synthesis type-I polyketide synthase A